MIYGFGIDILRAERISAAYQRFGDRFVQRILMPEELEFFGQHKRPERFLAMRFAAKEAIVKAMGTGFAHGMWVRDSGVIHNRLGRPEIIFSSRGRKKCDQLGIAGGHMTLSDEAGLVVAVAILMSTT
ncbi:MAG: holo-ACP synthase [Gammaproteobacteria bacterium]|jgi:holo-[acyl-carrier protein] synthase|nr:holo-ACP synthase [Chromatiales bacterium]MDP6674814.1 holo-ACP synthase [Gammaproteobacteria bacterium]